jgi:hypothetical protein
LPTDESSDSLCESPAVPEIVDMDLTAPNTWPRRGPFKQRPINRRIAIPSMSSQCSARQSEMSFGILDYYIRDPSPSPLQSPDFPPPRFATPVLDPAIEKFDFGLSPTTEASSPCTPATPAKRLQPQLSDTNAGAEMEAANSKDTNIQQMNSNIATRPAYRLFPTVKEDPPATESTVEPRTPPSSSVASSITFVPSHPQPDPSYRPRKESMSSSVRSRKDSITSFSGTRRIPMRVLSSSTTATKARSTSSPSTSPAEGPSPAQSRWSDETITSPLVATTSGPRTSFGSLSGNDTSKYPACFFEDDEDDEAAPLRRKFRWKRSFSLQEQRRSKAGRFDDRLSFGRRMSRVLLCGGCCG